MVAPENSPVKVTTRCPHAPNRHAAGDGRCVAARDWASGKAHRDCRHGPTEHQHANREHESPPHSKTKTTAAQATHPGAVLNPGELFCQLPGAAGIEKPLKFSGKAAAGFRGGVKPAHRTAANRSVTLAPKALDDRRAF